MADNDSDKVNNIKDNLFIPMLGRIYASENFPKILNDKKALELKDKIPENIKNKAGQTQYTLIENAVLSENTDRYVQEFLENNENGIIVQIGCGFETSFYRNDNGKTQWYEVSSQEVIDSRKKVLGECDRDKYIVADIFSEDWIKTVRKEHSDEPVLVIATSVSYYYTREKIVELLNILRNYGSIDIVFDALNSAGMRQVCQNMKQAGQEDASMCFYVDNALSLTYEVEDLSVVKEEPFYAHTRRRGLKFSTSMTMKLSDSSQMLKMVHLRLN